MVLQHYSLKKGSQESGLQKHSCAHDADRHHLSECVDRRRACILLERRHQISVIETPTPPPQWAQALICALIFSPQTAGGHTPVLQQPARFPRVDCTARVSKSEQLSIL